MKELLWKDKSGRGFSNTLTNKDIFELENKEDWNDEFLHDWVQNCSVGDEWEDRTSKIICISE